MIGLLGIWEKILGGFALVASAAAGIFYLLFRIQKGKSERLEDDVENLEDDLDESIRISNRNEEIRDQEDRMNDQVDDFEDNADKIGKDGYDKTNPDDLPDDEIEFGNDYE
jgi:hypothetical protein